MFSKKYAFSFSKDSINQLENPYGAIEGAKLVDCYNPQCTFGKPQIRIMDLPGPFVFVVLNPNWGEEENTQGVEERATA